jgi:Protein of unknown function (DUF3048) N-terminal domain/Protein of unknown function (DUF3048) C-terminal domain
MEHRRTWMRLTLLTFLAVSLACNVPELIAPINTPGASTDTPPQEATLIPVEQTAASGTEVAPETTPEATAEATTAAPTESSLAPVVYPIGPDNFSEDINPLTGLRVSDSALLDRRPLAIKVSNFPRSARPQAGLSQADLIFEYYTESGNTRFMAMYYGQEASKVGPIRSARVEDTRIVPLYDAILVHVQAYQDVWDQMYSSGVDFINEFPASCPAICRDPNEKIRENSAFGNTVELTKYANVVRLLRGRPNLNGMLFDTTTPAGGGDAASLWVRFSAAALAEWRYDAVSDSYLRLSESESGAMVPLTDRVTGTQLAVSNAVILFVPFNRYVGKTTTAEMWDLNTSGEGKAVFFRDGKVFEGTWKRVSASQPLQLLGPSGSVFPLQPGNTWIGIIGKNSGVTRDVAQWQFRMAWP